MTSSTTASSSARPQIQVVRLPSNERAKITLDGVQLRAQYNHFRTGDYVRACARSSGALDKCAVDRPGPHHRSEELLLRAQDSDPSAHCYHFCLSRRREKQLITNSVETLINNNIRNKKNSSSGLSTKSCDNIFEKYFVRSKEKLGWKDTTRSEEHLSYIGRKQTNTNAMAKVSRDRETAASTGGLAGRLLSRLLRRLQPRHSKRSEVTTPTELQSTTSSASPWILVSFSRRDLEGDTSPPHKSPSQTTAQSSDQPSAQPSGQHVHKNTQQFRGGGSGAAGMSGSGGGGGADTEVTEARRQRGEQVPVPSTYRRHHGAANMHLDSATLATHRLRGPTAQRVSSSARHQAHAARHQRLLAATQHGGVVAGPGGGRPHTLYIAPSSPAKHEKMEHRGTLRKMAASFESIGSCSLDVDVTASESSGLVDSRNGCGSLSQRTLHSLDSQKLVTQSTEELSTSSRHYVKRAAKLFDSTEDPEFNAPRARPSYVSLSCSVSGYTRATNYSSSRLRDPSPCARGSPAPLLLSRTAHTTMNGHNNSAPMNGHDSVDCSVRTNGSSPSKTHFSKQTFISHKSPNSTYTETSSWLSGRSESGVSNGQAGANTAKSFIQQRVERLYGRGALAQGFFRQTKLNGDTAGNLHSKSSDTTNENQPASLPELPVLRLLRPEFREQLSINSPHSTPWWRHRQSPPCTSNGTEHIIPITLEADHPAVKPSELHSSEAENEMTTSIKIDVATQAEEAPRDMQPAAPDVMVLSAESSLPAATSSQQQKDPDLKDGHYFLKLLGKECERLLAMAAETEKVLEANPELPEEASGKLRAAIGQARLLVRQKLQQFEGLCHRNLSQSCDEQFPTTCDDLAGFWDMVQLQVAHVDSLFVELEELRQRNWQELSPRKVVKNGSSKAASTRRSTTPKSSPQLSEKAQEAARQRDEQRKKLMEERRRTAKMQKKQQDAVEIFTPDTAQ